MPTASPTASARDSAQWVHNVRSASVRRPADAPRREAQSVRAALDANAVEMRQCAMTQIFSGSKPTFAELLYPTEEETGHGTSRLRSRDATLSDAQEAVVAAAVTEVECRHAHEAERRRRQVEIHVALLTAAHDEATTARDAAIREAQALRAEATTRDAHLRQCQTQLEMLQGASTAAATEAAEALRLAESRHVEALRITTASAAVERRLLRLELRQCEAPALARVMHDASPVHFSAGTMAAGVKAVPEMSQAAAGEAPQALVAELRRWAMGSEVSEGWGRPPSALVKRLSRLELAAEAAARRYEWLEAEHMSLRRRHRKLFAATRKATTAVGNAHPAEGGEIGVVARLQEHVADPFESTTSA